MSGGENPFFQRSLSELNSIKYSHLSHLSSIKYSYHTDVDIGHGRPTALVIRFEGSYLSDDEADFMCDVIAAGCEEWDPGTLVLDLSMLTYSWGDMMAKPLGMHSMQRPGLPPVLLTVAVISERNYAGLFTLVRDEMSSNPEDLLFESLEDALTAVQQRLKEYQNAEPPSEEQILNLITRLKKGEGTDAEAEQWIEMLNYGIPCPSIWELIFLGPDEESPETILNNARQQKSE